MRPVTQHNSSTPTSHQRLPGTTVASRLRIPSARLRERGCAIYLSYLSFFFFIVQAQWREEQRQQGGEGGCGGKTMSRRETVTEDNKGRGGEPVWRQRQGGVQATERTREQNCVAGRTFSRKNNKPKCASSGLKQEGAHNFFVSFNVDGQQPKAYLLDIYSQMPLFVFRFDLSHYFFLYFCNTFIFTTLVCLFFNLCCFYSESDAGYLFLIWHLWFLS